MLPFILIDDSVGRVGISSLAYLESLEVGRLLSRREVFGRREEERKRWWLLITRKNTVNAKLSRITLREHLAISVAERSQNALVSLQPHEGPVTCL